MSRYAELANDEDVDRNAEGVSNGACNGDATPGKPEDDEIGVGSGTTLSDEQRAELSARIESVSESTGHDPPFGLQGAGSARYAGRMVIVLIAAYNEEQALPSILHAIPADVNGSSVLTIVVDDGSTDGTGDVSEAAGCVTIRQRTNIGKGAALKAGIRMIESYPCEALVLMDGDGQHDPADIERIAGPVLDHSADMVVGSRYVHNRGRGSTPLNRYAVRSATVSVLRSVLDLNLTDPFSGFRCLSPAMLSYLELRGDRYESELEMAFCAARSSRAVVEVPIERIYGSGTSKMGARLGPTLGRINVVYRYAATIARETRATPSAWSRSQRSAAPT